MHFLNTYTNWAQQPALDKVIPNSTLSSTNPVCIESETAGKNEIRFFFLLQTSTYPFLTVHFVSLNNKLYPNQ